MKKVFSVLVLTSFLAVLAVPVLVSAAECGNCVTPPAEPNSCTCGAGSNVLTKESGLYCYKGTVYTSQAGCLAASGTTGGTGGDQVGKIPAPENIINEPGDLIRIIEDISDWIFTILLSVAGIMLILAGFFWITAGGNPENVKKASDMLRNALIGVAVAVGAKGLVVLIKSIIGG